MHRNKSHKIKRENPESSSSLFKDNEEHDLAYYIHDRVELMHQVFSVIKPKELKAMTPQCVQHISIDDLQELCTEELLGISSKRLCAILDGADPPTDTDSSSSEQLEIISLDSISSDDEILSQPTSKSRKHKHKKHKSKSKQKRKNSDNSDKNKEDREDRSKASRAGLTVLELLELQARARAIRAQLQQDNNINKAEDVVVNEKKDSSEDEVEIKEEPSEVVEISSEEEKLSIDDLHVKSTGKEDKSIAETLTKVKRINNLIITVPQSTSTKKIKLRRNKTVTIPTITDINTEIDNNISNEMNNTLVSNESVKILQTENVNKDELSYKPEQTKKISKPKKKQKKKPKSVEKDGSDHDEITLQLSDTEKMDLLENFDRKNYDNLTNSSSKDSESSSESTSGCDSEKEISKEVTEPEKSDCETIFNDKHLEKGAECSDKCNNEKDSSLETAGSTIGNDGENFRKNNYLNTISKDTGESVEKVVNLDEDIESVVATQDCNISLSQDITKCSNVNNKDEETENKETLKENINIGIGITEESGTNEQLEEGEEPNTIERNKDLSDGEISEKKSLENESMDVVFLSQEEKQIKTKTNNKKDKKAKKEKKSKRSKKDFHEGADQNFFKNSESSEIEYTSENARLVSINFDHITNQSSKILIIDDDDDKDDIYEILELSEDNSDVEEESVLSKNPTAAEIAALSAKIDDIQNEDIDIDSENETADVIEDKNEVENVSWKDRYLGSNKVKRVLTTANILNAMRKKNKELKKKIEDSKHILKELPKVISPSSESNVLIEGSIEHFNTLQASTKYVDPVVTENFEKSKMDELNKNLTKEMEKDAKILLKMYKKLLKYNDMNKQKDPNKKRKKKQKKNKDKA